MIRTADTFEPMGPFKVVKAKDIGIEVDGVEKSLQETFDNLDFENLGKEIEKVNELPNWESASENKLYVVKSPATEQSQLNDSGKFQIYLKDPTTENSWLTLKPQKEIIVDQEFDPESENPQSGVAVQDAIKDLSQKVDEKLSVELNPVTPENYSNRAFLYTGETTENLKKNHTYKLKSENRLSIQPLDNSISPNSKTFLSNFDPRCICDIDGDLFYIEQRGGRSISKFSDGHWNVITLSQQLNGLPYYIDEDNNTTSVYPIYGNNVWKCHNPNDDSDSYFISLYAPYAKDDKYKYCQIVPDEDKTLVFIEKEFIFPEGVDKAVFKGINIWQDNNGNYYASKNSSHYILNLSSWTWEPISWSGLNVANFDRKNIWEDEEHNIYYSDSDKQFKFIGTDWQEQTWTGINPIGQYIWKLDDVIFYSKSTGEETPKHFVHERGTSNWKEISIDLNNLDGFKVAKLGQNYYYIPFNSDTDYPQQTLLQFELEKSFEDLTQQQIDVVLNNLEVYDEEGYFSDKAWNSLPPNFSAINSIWTDGNNIYYSSSDDTSIQYKLIKETNTWEPQTWINLPSNFSKSNIWTDGNNIYYSSSDGQYILNGDTWALKTWTSQPTVLRGSNIWKDGNNIYCSGISDDEQYILNGDTWDSKTWNKLPSAFYAYCVWTDGDNTYFSFNGDHFVLNGDIWESVTFNNLPSDFSTTNIWTDGENTYYSDNNNQYVLDKSTRTWTLKTWNGISSFSGKVIWKDGDNIYLSGNKQYFKHKMFKLRLKA